MYKKIIVPLDGSDLAECALPHVEAIGQGYGIPEITFLYVIKPSGNWEDWTFIRGEREKAEAYLEKKVQNARDKGLNANYHILVGNPADGVADYGSHPAGDTAEGIIDYAAKEGADLIIMATHGRSGISRWAYGSTADRVMRSSGIPVLMVRAPSCGLQAQYRK